MRGQRLLIAIPITSAQADEVNLVRLACDLLPEHADNVETAVVSEVDTCLPLVPISTGGLVDLLGNLSATETTEGLRFSIVCLVVAMEPRTRKATNWHPPLQWPGAAIE